VQTIFDLKITFLGTGTSQGIPIIGSNHPVCLSENSKDVLYGKAQWFMADEKVKRAGKIQPMSSTYDWVTDSINAESDW